MTIDSIVIVAKCSDGKYRQVLIDTATEQDILDAIMAIEGKIRVLDKPLDGIEIIKSSNNG